MVNPTICFIVCFYKGARDANQQAHYNEYLTTHKNMLIRLQHNICKVIFVISEDNRQNIETIVDFSDNITYFYRPNNGLSFGGWIDVCKTYKELYDYYIFCEDDYYFIKHNFDKILIDEYKLCNKQYMVTYRDKKYIPNLCKFQGELISTIGIISSIHLHSIEYFKNFSFANIKHRAMTDFFEQFDTIGSISENNERFVYYTGNEIIIYDNNNKYSEKKIKIEYYCVAIKHFQNTFNLFILRYNIYKDKYFFNFCLVLFQIVNNTRHLKK